MVDFVVEAVATGVTVVVGAVEEEGTRETDKAEKVKGTGNPEKLS